MSVQRPQEVFDVYGRHIRLGARLGQGGEGAVYEIASNDNTVAKIYHNPLTSERAEKIRAMMAMRAEPMGTLTAWPITLLSRRTGEAVGLVMPKVVGHKDIHHLYSPKSRRNDFQRANWHFLIRAATNLARAVASIHESGCVIGDVNPGGILVAQDARVRLIDCDSFQIKAKGRQFLCHVGVPHFTPPELQGRDFSGLVRTPNHDNFGLAVLIFLMLFMGRHPFAGRFLGAGDMPIEKAIAEYRFVYGRNRAAAKMDQPPGTPSLDVASGDVALLFERAFERHTASGSRPGAREWIAALETLEKKLKQCAINSSHIYLGGLSTCPWCEMEAKAGIPLFPLSIPRAPGGLLNLEDLWKQVSALPHPGVAPPIENPTLAASLKPSPDVQKLRGRQSIGPFLTLLAGVAPIAVGLFVAPKAILLAIIAGIAAAVLARRTLGGKEQIEDLVQARSNAEQRWKQIVEQWNERAGSDFFDKKRAELDGLRKDLESLPTKRLMKLNDLMARRRDTQLEQFLDRFEIPAKGVSGIGPARKATLESYGIETAADINPQKLGTVPGIGPTRLAALLKWRRSVEAKFRFDSSKGIEPQDQARVEQEIMNQRQTLISRFQTALAELKQISSQIEWARKNMRDQVETEYRQYLQAAANAKALGR